MDKTALGIFIEHGYKNNFAENTEYENFCFVGFLGKGSFGAVYEIKDKSQDLSYAVKIILKESSFEKVKREAEIHSKLDHPNIIAVIFLFETENYVAIVMEKCEKDLFDTLYRDRICLEEALNIFKTILNAVLYIHEKGYSHRDIKLENIMKTRSNEWKLIDFSFSAPKDEKINNMNCTLDYMAPEIVSVEGTKDGYYMGQPTDIWSLGILLYELTCRHQPFRRTTFKKTYEAIKTDSPIFPEAKKVPENLKTIILKMLEKKPENRPVIKEVIEYMQNL